MFACGMRAMQFYRVIDWRLMEEKRKKTNLGKAAEKVCVRACVCRERSRNGREASLLFNSVSWKM